MFLVGTADLHHPVLVEPSRLRKPFGNLVKASSETSVFNVLLGTVQVDTGKSVRGFVGSLIEELKFGEEVLRSGLRKTVNHFGGLLNNLNFMYAMLASHNDR